MKNNTLYVLLVMNICLLTQQIQSMLTATRPALQQAGVTASKLLPTGMLPKVGTMAAPIIPAQVIAEATQANISQQTKQQVMNALSRRGVRQQAQGFEQFSTQHPEALRLAEYYAQMGKQAEASAMLDYLANASKMTQASTQSLAATDSLETVMQQNANLEQLLTRHTGSIDNTIYNILQPLESMAFKSGASQNIYNAREQITNIQNNFDSIISKPSTQASEAASKLAQLEQQAQQFEASMQSLTRNSTNATEQNIFRKASQEATILQQQLKTARNQLATPRSSKQAPTKTATPQEFEQMIENLSKLKPSNMQEKQLVDLGTSTPLSQGTAQAQTITPVNQALTSAMQEQAPQLHQSISQVITTFNTLEQSINQLPQLTQEQSNVVKKLSPLANKQLTEIKNIFDHLATFQDPQAALNAYLKHAPGVVRRINDIALLVTEILNALTPEQQMLIRPALEKLTTLLQTSAQHAQVLRLISQEVLSESSALKTAHAVLQELALNQKVSTAVQNMKASTSTLDNILKTKSTNLQTDKGPMTMVEMVQKNLQDITTTLRDLQTIKNMNDVEVSIDSLQKTMMSLTQNLNAIESKIQMLLPQSGDKQAALQELEKIRNLLQQQEAIVKEFIAQLGKVNETHIWINITKDTIQQGITHLLDGGKEALFYTQTHDLSKTSEQQAALQKLSKKIVELKSIEKQLDTISTPEELRSVLEKLNPQEMQKLLPEPTKLLLAPKPGMKEIEQTINNDYQFLHKLIIHPLLTKPIGESYTPKETPLARTLGKPYAPGALTKTSNLELIIHPLFESFNATLQDTLQLFGLKLGIAGGILGLMSLIPLGQEEEKEEVHLEPKTIKEQTEELQEISHALPLLEKAAQHEATLQIPEDAEPSGPHSTLQDKPTHVDRIIQASLDQHLQANKQLAQLPEPQMQQEIQETKSFISQLNLQDYKIVKWVKGLADYINNLIQDLRVKGIYKTYSERKQKALNEYNQWLHQQYQAAQAEWNPFTQ